MTMKNLLFYLLILIAFSCKTSTENENKANTEIEEIGIEIPAIPPGEHEDNPELMEIYTQDQADRQSDDIDWTVVSENDKKREKRIKELITSGAIKTSNDFKAAAMIYQHGGDSEAYGMAVKLMKKAVELNPNANKWLLAAATDRYLLSIDKPQIYGTQYSKKNEEGAKWEISEMDTTQVTDAERMEYNVETLAQQKEKVKFMNLTKLSTLLKEGKSIDEVILFIKSEDMKDSEYNITESGINSFGYSLMAGGLDDEALKIFKLNTELYPNGFNTHDSYGECLLKLGQKDAARKAYEKSVELNPQNQGAIDILAKM